MHANLVDQGADAASALILCRMHQRGHCVWVPSATVGLTLTLAALGLEGCRVAIPSGVCLNVPLAVKYADARPVYCDIDEASFGLDAGLLSRVSRQIEAVLAVHAYGNPCDMDSLTELCRQANIPLIEDVAVAQGALTPGGRPAGSFGVASVASFGRGKIIDVGGGGAVLSDDAALAGDIRRRLKALPPRSETDEEEIEGFSSAHTRLYNQHYGKDIKGHLAAFIEMASGLRRPVLTSVAWDREAAARGFESLPRDLARRRGLARQLFGRLASRADIGFDRRQLEHSAVWRANLFLPHGRDRVLRSMLDDGFKVSSWYPPAQDFLETGDIPSTPVAARVGREILNIWVNAEVDADYVDAVVAKIESVIGAS